LEGANGIQGAISDQVQRPHQCDGDQRHELQRRRHQCRYDRRRRRYHHQQHLPERRVHQQQPYFWRADRHRSDSTINGAIVDSGRILAADFGILVSGGVVSGGIQVAAAGKIVTSGTHGSGIKVTTSNFAGGIANSGKISAGVSNDGIFVLNSSLFSGGIRNNSGGRIAAGSSGIEVKLVTTFAGSISNAGTISTGDVSRVGVYLSKDAVFGSNSAGGGITNTGTIFSAAGAGIDLVSVATVFGSIVNKGKIIAGHGGIDITSGTIFGAGSADGGITNSGTISAGHSGISVNAATFLGNIINASGGKIVAAGSHRGIFVSNVSTFGGSGAGGITNIGSISAGFSAIKALDVSLFSGGIENDGTLTTAFNGVLLEGITTFAGGINNKGTIFAGSGGIAVGGSQSDGTIPVATFTGNIANTGIIVAKTGFSILDSTIQGALVDSGTIRASGDGIHVSIGGDKVEADWIASAASSTVWGRPTMRHDPPWRAQGNFAPCSATSRSPVTA
jgi:hypothetical protein